MKKGQTDKTGAGKDFRKNLKKVLTAAGAPPIMINASDITPKEGVYGLKLENRIVRARKSIQLMKQKRILR